MNKRSTSIAAALLVGAFALGLTGCGSGDEATAQPEPSASTPASAASTAAAELPIRPETVLLDMDKTAMNPAVVEAYANPNIDKEISAAAEEFFRTGLSFPELQKASHIPSAADLAVMEPFRPLVSDYPGGYWERMVEELSAGRGNSFPPIPGPENEDSTEPDPEWAKPFEGYVQDDSGFSFLFKNDGMEIVYAPYENGTPGVKVKNIKTRLMFTAVTGEVLHLDRTLSLHLYLAPDTTWDVSEYGGPVDDSGVSATQEELDALPPL